MRKKKFFRSTLSDIIRQNLGDIVLIVFGVLFTLMVQLIISGGIVL